MSDTQNTAMATTMLPLAALQPNDYNPNQMADEQFAELVEEVRHLGRLRAWAAAIRDLAEMAGIGR